MRVLIKGTHLEITLDKEVLPGKKLGSVPTYLEPGNVVLLHVCGNIPNLDSRDDVKEFEIAVREFCESPEVISRIFGTFQKGRTKRFNPSRTLARHYIANGLRR